MFMSYFFDADSGTVAPVRLRKTRACEDARELIGCEQTDHVFLGSEHVVIFDDNGLVDGLSSVMQIEGVGTPLAASLVIAGIRFGELTTPLFSIDEVASRIDIMRPLLDMYQSEPAYSAVGFNIRVVKDKPRVLNSTPSHLKLVG
ncbi:UNVERIFIED_ORG: hypothetical protein BCL66_1063 [Martelella mediterranea]